MHLATGDRVEFFRDDQGNVTLVVATQSVAASKGIVGKPAQPVSLEHRREAIAEAGSGRK